MSVEVMLLVLSFVTLLAVVVFAYAIERPSHWDERNSNRRRSRSTRRE